MQRIVVLISGEGTNLQAILDASSAGELPAVVAAVLSNRAEAFGLERARRKGVPVAVVELQPGQGRRAYDTCLAERIAPFRPDWIVLAGWMRILSSEFLDRFPDRVLNLHPALPGTFPGTHAIERAFAAWTRGEIDRSGVMVHLVPDEGVDAGPVLGSEEVRFQAGETLEAFTSRMHAAEHQLLLATLRKVLRSAESGGQ